MTHFDLSQSLSGETQVYPGDPAVTLEPHATVTEEGYRVTRCSLGTHAGTHVDAPAHTEPDGKTLDEFDVDAFAFEAARVDCTDHDAREPITRSDLPGTPPPVDLLVLHTGWDAHWKRERYLDHPFLAPEAAEWCANEGFHVALDALSPDPTPTERGGENEPEGVPAHHALLGAERFVIENLCGLDRVPDRFELRAYPLPVVDADGAPVRAVAVC